MTLSTAKLIKWFTNVLAYGGISTLAVAALWERSWITNWAVFLLFVIVTVALRSMSISIGKYSYISPSAIVALSGALLVGPVTTAMGIAGGIAIVDGVVFRKTPWAVLVNIGREVIALFAAFGLYAATMVVAEATTPVSPEGVPSIVIFALSYFVYWRWLFYFSLMARGKLRADDRQLMVRYEIIISAILTVGSGIVVFSVLYLPVTGWVFMSALLVPAGLLIKRMLEEAIRAEELNKLHAMDAIVSGAISLDDSLKRIEQLAHRILDWGDFRLFRRESANHEPRLLYRGVIGRPERSEPPVEFEVLRDAVCSHGDPVLIRHAAGDPRTATLPGHIACAVVYPIRLGNDIIGTFELEHHKTGTYRREHLPLLDACATRIATAIHIADLRRPLLDTVVRIGTEVGKLKTIAELLSGSANDMRSASEAIGTNLVKQEGEVIRGLEDAEQLNKEGRAVADGGAMAATASAEASHVADQSRATLSVTIEKLVGVKDLVSESSEKIDGLGDLARSIVTRVGSIREQAALTQLLALNAGIDLAHDADGRGGFGIVADEIRQLADNTGAAANDVVSLVAELREQLGDVMDHLQHGRVSVTGAESMGVSGLESMESIVEATKAATSEARRIALSAEGQRSVIQGLRGRMANVAAFSEQNRQAAERLLEQGQFTADRLDEVGRAIAELESVANMLADLTDRFTFVDNALRS